VTKFATTCVALVVVLMLTVAGGAIAVVQSVFGTSDGGVDCAPAGATATSAAGYGPQQMGNAATIVAVGRRLNVPESGWVIAMATAITDPGCRISTTATVTVLACSSSGRRRAGEPSRRSWTLLTAASSSTIACWRYRAGIACP